MEYFGLKLLVINSDATSAASSNREESVKSYINTV